MRERGRIKSDMGRDGKGRDGWRGHVAGTVSMRMGFEFQKLKPGPLSFSSCCLTMQM